MKAKTVFLCSDCGYDSVKWYGKCPSCGEWNTMSQMKVEDTPPSASRLSVPGSKPVRLNDVAWEDNSRMATPINEFNRVLGGGLVDGSVVLVGGDPGIGKSTLLLQVCAHLSDQSTVLYVSGEESASQIKLRSMRLLSRGDNLLLLSETSMDNITAAIENQSPRLVVIDSIQTMYKNGVSSSAGSVTQVRECAMQLISIAKNTKTIIILVGHVTKEGAIAGPRVLEHMVDCVLYFEGDKNHSYRILRAVKNRYGSTNEIGVFEMTGTGLCEVDNPSLMLIEGRPKNVSGSCVACAIEGTRPVLVEVQALLSKSAFAAPRRMCTGFDYNRASLLLAVLEKRCGLSLSNQDAYINVVGGFKLDDPAADLAVALSIVSSFRDSALTDGLTAIGEIGLSGEIRSVSGLELRIKEAIRLGFTNIIIPRANKLPCDFSAGEEISILRARNIMEAVQIM